MDFLVYLSDFIMPLLFFYIISYGLLSGRPIYNDFINGAKDGLRTVVGIMPTLVGLMVAVGILRASGFLDFMAQIFSRLISDNLLPAPVIPIILVKMFSSSAATGLVLDLFKEYGPDSLIGVMTSIMMSCTETVFYTMSIYFMSVKVKKTRYTLAGALFATLGGVLASIILATLGGAK